MRPRFLLTPIGSGGDVHPFLAIGRELLRRGNEVIVMTNEIYREQVESLGLQFIQIGTRDEMRRVGTDPRIHKLHQAWKLALKWGTTGTMRETYEAIGQHHVQGHTVVVGAIMSFGARIASERFRLPFATLLIDPDKLRGSDHAPVLPPLVLSDRVPKCLKKLQYWVADHFVLDPLLAPETNSFRAEVGLPPVKRLLNRWWFSPNSVIGLFDDWFAPASADWPPNVQLVGPALWNPPVDAQEASSIVSFVRDGQPPIVFIAGSAGPSDNNFYKVAVESSIRLNRRAIFLHNSKVPIPANLPNTIRHHRYYSPLNHLLTECLALVHHGGTGTAAHAMSAGIPQLVSPQAFDQPDIASRLKKIGVARLLPPKQFDVRRVTKELTKLLDDSNLQLRCKAIAEKMENGRGIESASDLLENLQPTKNLTEVTV